MNRRDLIRKAGIAGMALYTPGIKYPEVRRIPGAQEFSDPGDEEFWRSFARQWYSVSADFTNLENGYFGVQPSSVVQAYHANIDLVNTQLSRFMRKDFYPEYFSRAMSSLEEMTGAERGELLLTRNATEALNIVIQGMKLEKGDEVILQKNDYHSVIEIYEMLEAQKGIKLVWVDIPRKPSSSSEVVGIYEQAITNRTRCILLTHLNHLTGLILPVADISRMARNHGVPVIVDAAHSFAQVDYRMNDLDADFIVVNLHKWFGNPLGAGLLFIRKDKVKDISPFFGDFSHEVDDIRKLGHFGTPAAPVVMTIPEAARFNSMVGIPNKEGRLHYLKNYWTMQAAKLDRVDVVTPVDPKLSCGIASFRIDGMDSYEVVRRLDEKYGIFTVIRKLADGVVVRVTPNLYNGTTDLDKLLDALQQIARG